MSTLGAVHLVFAFLAILAGAVVLMLRKGTRWHRTWGHAYVWSMAGVVATSFSLYNLTGTVGPFHFAALVAGLTVVWGMGAVLLRRPRKQWIEAHATIMAWSYVGLMAAFTAESLSRFVMPRAAALIERDLLPAVFWGSVGLATLVTVAVGAWVVRRRLPASIRDAPRAMRS